ncbi:MAG: hypothetical protein HRT35_09195 [Algicola sp.]|nr:hypothetical protein [Algicola sp.]
MNLEQLKDTWQGQNEQLQSGIKLNEDKLKTFETQAILRPLLNKRIIEAIFTFVIVILLWQYIVANFGLTAPVVSAAILNVFALINLAGNIGQIALISQIDYAKPISEVQKQIFDIRQHNLVMTKLVALSLPFYGAYVFLGFDLMFGIDLYKGLHVGGIFSLLLGGIAFLPAVIWFNRQLRFANLNTGWVSKMIESIGGQELLAAAQVMNTLQTSDK